MDSEKSTTKQNKKNGKRKQPITKGPKIYKEVTTEIEISEDQEEVDNRDSEHGDHGSGDFCSGDFCSGDFCSGDCGSGDCGFCDCCFCMLMGEKQLLCFQQYEHFIFSVDCEVLLNCNFKKILKVICVWVNRSGHK